MKIILSTLLLLLCQLNTAQRIEKYNADIVVDINKHSFEADFQIYLSEIDQTDTIKLFIHEAALISSITSKSETLEYTTTTEKLVGEDKAILIPVRHITGNRITISYSNNLDAVKNPNFKFNPHWIEFNIYTTWFPLNIDYGLFDYEINIDTEADIIGSGVLNNKTLRSVIPFYDIAFVLSDKILRTETANGTIDVYHYNVGDTIIGQIQQKSNQYFAAYESMFGATDSSQLSIAVNTFDRTIKYARPQFISFSLDSLFTKGNQKTLAHEIGHLWWNKADVTIWEDWLNEGFAEYSALLIYRREHGEIAFKNAISVIEKRIKGLPPILDIDKRNQDSNTVLTYKGAFLLYQLENKIGESDMAILLKKVHESNSNNTDQFLRLLSGHCTPKIATWFMALLGK